MKNILEHSKYELERANLFTRGESGVMDGQIGEAAMQIMEIWAAIGVSGPPAAILRDILYKLMGQEPLGPLTNDPAEWHCIGTPPEMQGLLTWVSERHPQMFSRDAGRTFFDGRVPPEERQIFISKQKEVIPNASDRTGP